MFKTNLDLKKSIKVLMFFIIIVISMFALRFINSLSDGLLSKRFVNGVVFSPEQIEKNMCLKWPKLPNTENPSDGYYTYSHLLICSALFPKRQFFENGGYKIQNFNKVSAVVTYPFSAEDPVIDFKNTIQIIEKKCPNCALTKRNFKGEAEKEFRSGKYASDNYEIDRLNGLFFYFSPWINYNGNFLVRRRILGLVNNNQNYTFYDDYAMISFPNAPHNEFGAPEENKKLIEKKLGEEIELLFLTNEKYGKNYIQFLAGKKTKKIHSVTCFYIMDNGNSESVKYQLTVGSQEMTNYCIGLAKTSTNSNTNFKDPISEKPIFFLKEVNNLN